MNLLIDTDIGVDDAIAIMMILADPDVNVVGITGVAGNVALDDVMRNIGIALDVMDAPQIPFYRGSALPIIGDHRDAGSVHGDGGLGGTRYPSSTRAPEDEHAALALSRLAREYAGDVTLLALGPLTNVALAARLDPDFMRNVERLVVMGGAVDARGNVTETAEYNIWADPEAAHIVFDTAEHIWLVSWEATLAHAVPWADWDDIIAGDTAKAQFMHAISDNLAGSSRGRRAGFPLPDPLAASVTLAPEAVVAAPERYVTVELAGTLTRGQTVVDYRGVSSRAPNTRVVTEFDLDTFIAHLQRAVR